MTFEQRLARLEMLSMKRDAERWHEAFDAIEKSRWSWKHILDLAGGEAEIESLRQRLMERAKEFREMRISDGYAPRGTALDIATSVLSFRSDEEIPDDYPELIDRFMARLSGCPWETIDFQYAFQGALAKLVLVTRDGLPVRRRLWDTRP